ncbi:hypothetical protein ES708_13203 [subsurface metagenome]|jgi:hypothetical protein
METKEREALIQEGRNQVLYLMLCIGDENVAHDNWHPDMATVLVQTRQEIVKRLKHPRTDGVMNTVWPPVKEDGTIDWPNFETYPCRAG